MPPRYLPVFTAFGPEYNRKRFALVRRFGTDPNKNVRHQVATHYIVSLEGFEPSLTWGRNPPLCPLSYKEMWEGLSPVQRRLA